MKTTHLLSKSAGMVSKIWFRLLLITPGENTTVNSTAIYKLTRYCYIKRLTINATNCNVNGLLNHLEYKQLNFFMLSIGVDSRGEKGRFKRKINRMHMRENVRWLNYHVNIIDWVVEPRTYFTFIASLTLSACAYNHNKY